MNEILFARYLESINHRLNDGLDKIQEHLPVEEIEYDNAGKPIWPCCWPLVKVLIEIVETSQILRNGGTLPERDDSDTRYTVVPEVEWSKIPANGEYRSK